MSHDDHPSLRADRDPRLLARPELRPVRLELDYLKPELALQDQGIRGTVVVFGGTRVVEPAEAAGRLEEARELHAKVADADSAEQLRAAERANHNSRFYEVSRELGSIIGRAARDAPQAGLVLVTGGGPGAMEAANRGAHDIGAPSAGFNIVLPEEQRPNAYITPELHFEFRYFALRKLHFMLRARALIALPGGYGTFDELFETLCLIQTHKREAIPVVLIGESFWRRAVDFEYLADEGMISRRDLELFQFAETAREAWQLIQGWYAARGDSILRPKVPRAESSGRLG